MLFYKCDINIKLKMHNIVSAIFFENYYFLEKKTIKDDNIINYCSVSYICISHKIKSEFKEDHSVRKMIYVEKSTLFNDPLPISFMSRLYLVPSRSRGLRRS